MVNGIAQNYGYDNYYLTNSYYKPVQMQQGTATNTTLFGGVTEQKDNTADGKDDGSIGFWGATKNLAKGAWNFLTSPFKNDKGEWSLGSTLKSVAIAGAFLVGNALTGGALTPILLAGGAIAGVWGAGKAAYNIATAETDAQAEAAWQSMGSSAATIAATAVGAKSYAKSSAVAEGLDASKYDGVTGTFKAVGKTFVDSKDNIVAGTKIGWNYGTTKFGQIKDAYNNSSKETWYGKAGEVLTKGRDAAVKKGQNWLTTNSKTYANAQVTGAEMTSTQKLEALNEVRHALGRKFNAQVGIDTSKGITENAQAFVSNPQNIAIYTNATSQTVKPDFYDSLSAQEQAQFDALPKEQQEQIKDTYYSLV